MKRSLLLLAASLSYLTTAQAEIVEGNVTLQLKLTRQLPDKIVAPHTITKQSVTSYKNADFIKKVAEIEGKNFSKAAKLIFTSNNGALAQYYIRDKDVSLEVTNYLQFIPRIAASPGPPLIISGKTTEAPKLGNEQISALVQLNIIVPQDEEDSLRMDGLMNQSVRYLRSKEEAQRSISFAKITITGQGYFVFPIEGQESTDRGLLQGSIKLTSSKILPSPPLPPET